MWATIAGVLQIVLILLKNYLEKEEDEKARKNALRQEASDAIVSGNLDRINSVILKLRNK